MPPPPRATRYLRPWILVLAGWCTLSHAILPSLPANVCRQPRGLGRRSSSSSSSSSSGFDGGSDDDGVGDGSVAEQELSAIRAPLRWVGPYPALALSFPEVATAAQREKGVFLNERRRAQ